MISAEQVAVVAPEAVELAAAQGVDPAEVHSVLAESVRGVGGSGVLPSAGWGAPHHWCDVHHLLHWAFGGETNLENSGLLCERHHTQVHAGSRVDRDTAGRWHTYRPDDTEIVVHEPLLAA